MDKVLPSPRCTRDCVTAKPSQPRSHLCLSQVLAHVPPHPKAPAAVEAAHTALVVPPSCPQPLQTTATLGARQWDRHRDAAQKETTTKFTPQLFPLTPQQPAANLVLLPSCLICFHQPQAKGSSPRERSLWDPAENSHPGCELHAGSKPSQLTRRMLRMLCSTCT